MQTSLHYHFVIFHILPGTCENKKKNHDSSESLVVPFFYSPKSKTNLTAVREEDVRERLGSLHLFRFLHLFNIEHHERGTCRHNYLDTIHGHLGDTDTHF